MARKIRRRTAGFLPSATVLAAAFAVSIGAGIASVALSSPSTAPADASGPAAECETDDPLYITADPAITPTLSTLADDFAAMLAADDRPCVQIETRPMTARDVVSSLQTGWDTASQGPPPDVWIPDASAWMEVFRNESGDTAELPEDAPVVARSPLVIGMPKPMAEALPSAHMKWRDMLSMPDWEEGWGSHRHPEWGQPRLAVADPLRSTNGLLSLLSLGVAQDRLWAGGATGEGSITIDSDIGVLRFHRAVTTIVPDVGAQLRTYVDADDPLLEMSAIPLTERELWLFNRGQLTLPPGPDADAATDTPVAMDARPLVPLQAVYLTEGAFGADYPFVVMNGDWVDNAALQKAGEFEEFVLSDAGQERFQAAGFRGSQNRRNDVHTEEDGLKSSAGGDIPPPPEPDVVASVRRSWRNVTAPSKTLIVFDVSGSMVVSATGGEQTRLDASIDAAVNSLDVLPESSDVGLWEFSTDLPRGRNDGDYRELVPLGPLNEEIDGTDRKSRVVDELTGLEPEKDTALNDTALAAYEVMQSSFEPDVRHTIVLLTDGRNDDEGSISNDRVVQRLQDMHDDEQPVRIVAIAYGEETDIAQLERMTDATGGTVLASPNADDLDELFLAALAGSD